MNLKSPGSVPNFKSDGLSITATESWFKVKVQLIQSYMQAFIMNAAQKSDEIIFIDLFAGSGLYSSGHQKEIFAGSCLASLTGDTPFHKWIFCEGEVELAEALDKRVKRYFPSSNVTVVNADLQKLVPALTSMIPLSKSGHRIAVLCLVDPFSLNVPLDIIRRLTALQVSFLMPFTFPLNARLNSRYYGEEHADALKRFVGSANIERLSAMESNLHFYRKLVRMYQNSMLVMGLNAAVSSHRLNSRMMELPAYSIGFFSRQFPTQAIQRDVNVSENLQFELF